ncbi:MAG: insulinase family protein [bacterium]
MRKKYLVLSLLAIIVLCLPVCAEYTPERQIQWDPAVHRETLGNGLKIFLHENHRPEKRLELRLVVKAGALYEEDGTEGIAHFLEHMAFNGTKHFKAGELDKYFESVGVEYGGDNNAFTSHDQTTYLLTLPCDDLEVVRKGLTAISDYMAGILFEPEEVEKERGVILEELRLQEGLYKRLAQQAIKIAAEGTRWDSPRLFVVGSKGSVSSIKREDFLKFYKHWYRPDRMALILVGDLPVETMRKLVKEIIEPLPAAEGEPEFPEYLFPDHDEIYTGVISDREMPIGGGAFVFTRPKKKIITEADFRGSLIDGIIYTALNNRLRELKETQEPPFLEAGISEYAVVPWFELRFGFAASMKMKGEKRAVQSVIREMERARQHGFLESEIREELLDMEESARRAVKEKDKTFSSNFAYEYADAFMENSVSTSEEEYYRLIKEIAPTITPADAKANTKALLAPVNMSIGLALPDWQKKMYKKEDLKTWYDEVSAEKIPAYSRQELTRATDYSKLMPAKVVERGELNKVGAVRVQFENGLTLYLKKTDFQEDEINISSYNPFRAGWEESWRTFGITSMMGSLWNRGGTEEFKDTEITRLQKGKGFGITAGMSFGGWSISRDLEEAFTWIYDYMTAPGFREEPFKIIKEERRTEIKNSKLDQDYAFGRAVSEILCPGSTSALHIDDENYYDQFTAPQIREWWKQVFHPATMQFTIVGNIDIDKTIDLAARYLGNLPGGEVPDPPALLAHCTFPTGYTRREIYRGMEDKTRVDIYLPGPRWDAEEFPALGMALRIFEVRLRDKIREALGGTYYSYIYNTSDAYIKGKDYIVIGFATDPDRVKELTDAMDALIAEFLKEVPTQDELDSAREVLAKDWEEKLKENYFWVGVLNGAEYRPIPLAWEFDIHEKMMAVTTEQILAAAKKWLTPPTDRIEIIAYKERKPVEQPAEETEE